MIRCFMLVFCCVCCTKISTGQNPVDERAEFIRGNYTKSEVRIAMRDGVELFTSI